MNTGESNAMVPLPAANNLADRKVRQTLRDELRAEEWVMHQELMNAARVVLKNFYENPHKTTVADLARLIDLASKLGRLATTESDAPIESEGGEALVLEFRAALKKVYTRRQSEGKPLPEGAVIDAETVPTVAPAASSPLHGERVG